MKSDFEEYENKSNNPVTAQAKSTVNKKPRVFFPTTPSYHQTPQSRIVFNPPPETHWTKSLGKYGSLFGNLTPAAGQTEGNLSTWEQPPAQNLAELASPLMEETAILQPIGSSDKGKQPALAPREHSNTWIPIPLNITNITKLEKFSGEEDNAYSWIADAEKAITANSWNDDRTVQTLPFFLIRTTNSWYQSLAKKPTSFTKFKLAFLQYFCDPNTDYYTMVQVLNQFIKELWSSILRSIRPCHLTSLQDAVTLTRNFESAEQEANYTQAFNLAINRTSDIDAKITQLKLQELTNHPNGEKITITVDTHSNRIISNSNNLGDLIPATATTARNLDTLLISAKHGTPIFHTSELTASICTTSPVHSITTPELLSTITNDTSNLSLSNFPLHGLSRPIPRGPAQSRPTPTGYPNQASYFGLMEDQGFDKSTPVEGRDIKQISQPSKQTKSNIPPATITEDTTLAAIFPFDIDNLNTHSLFSGAAINQDKPITALYTDARVRGIDIKLILNSGSAVNRAATARIITVNGNTKTLIGKIDNFPFKINGIQIPTKVLVIEATQYQALVGNNWLSKANATLDWNTQELQLTFNGQHAQVPAMCEHFKNQRTEEPLIEFENTSMPPTIETYQVSWVDDYRTELPSPPTWKEKEKGRAKKEPQLSSLGYIILD
ncbi:hypothetical protein G9A89_013232 [Geosiphon pyriformis]|nr:hypothetical protein G9A89_013232 [Geosiphon pyriformis]